MEAKLALNPSVFAKIRKIYSKSTIIAREIVRPLKIRLFEVAKKEVPILTLIKMTT